jgi:hypothetical protein
MKKTLNKILYKLADSELNNSIVNEQAGEVWQRIKAKFSRNKYDYTPTISHTSDTEQTPGEEKTGDVIINTYKFKLSPPMANAYINSAWGKWRPSSGRRHMGIDMATDPGTSLYAVRPGSVVFIGSNPKGWGDYIITKHDAIETPNGKLGETFYALYAHLSDVRVSVNDEITYGQVIGLSGGVPGAPGSGNAEGPHLHFEIKTKQTGGSIDPVRFYAKYKQKLEYAPIIKKSDNLEIKKPADYIVKPLSTTLTTSPIETDLTADVKDSIVPGETEIDGFYVYELPSDATYLYGVPTMGRNELTYGWWFTNSYDTDPVWKLLKSTLTPANYSIAVKKLDDTYPNAIDQDRLATTELPQPKLDNTTNTNTTKKNQETNNEPKTDASLIFSKLKLHVKYLAASILKKNRVAIYSYNNKKFKHAYDVIVDDTDYLKYLGHDTANSYMHIRLISTAEDPTSNKRWWINVNDIKLSNKKKF